MRCTSGAPPARTGQIVSSMGNSRPSLVQGDQLDPAPDERPRPGDREASQPGLVGNALFLGDDQGAQRAPDRLVGNHPNVSVARSFQSMTTPSASIAT